jgi:hypothetical protein
MSFPAHIVANATLMENTRILPMFSLQKQIKRILHQTISIVVHLCNRYVSVQEIELLFNMQEIFMTYTRPYTHTAGGRQC